VHLDEVGDELFFVSIIIIPVLTDNTLVSIEVRGEKKKM